MSKRPIDSLLAVVAVTVAIGCTVEPGEGFGFDGAPQGMPQTGASDPSDSGGDTSGGEESTSSEPDESSSEDEGGNAPATSGVDPGTGESTGDPDPGDTGDTGGGSSDTGGQAVEQPATGMYSHCLSTPECTDPLGCIVDNGNQPTDGYCTDNCIADNDASNCDPSPGGTAVPTCISINFSPVCALDCAGGLTCPTGMVCEAGGTDNGVVEICI